MVLMNDHRFNVTQYTILYIDKWNERDNSAVKHYKKAVRTFDQKHD